MLGLVGAQGRSLPTLPVMSSALKLRTHSLNGPVQAAFNAATVAGTSAAFRRDAVLATEFDLD